ncbi:MAG: winged helix-turn-helix transcriptional regulator [Thermoplasmata archaeon]
MDPLDFAIYRYLSPGGEARFWAGRRVIDPTIPAREIADHVGISENGVRARVRSLTERGFLGPKAVTPNPSLFGVRVFVAEVPVKQTGEVERVLRDLALVEGVIFARDVMDEEERKIRVHFVSDTDSTTTRRAALLRRLSPTGELHAPQPYWTPPCDHELSPLDWRVLHAIWLHPDASIAEIAHSVGISLKTTARRYHQLIESHACWWTPGPTLEEFPLALVWLDLQGPEDREPVAGRIPREAPVWMPVASDGLGLDPTVPSNVIAGLVPADAPAILEKVLRKFAGLPGVTKVRRTFALGSMAYPAWFSEQIASRLRPRSKSPAQ